MKKKTNKMILAVTMLVAFIMSMTTVFANAVDIDTVDSAGNTFAESSGPVSCAKDYYWTGDSIYTANVNIGYDGILAGKDINFQGGKIGASLRAAGQNLTFSNLKVGHNMALAGQYIYVDKGTTTQGAYLAGQRVEFNGNSNCLKAVGKTVVINGTIKGNVDINAENVEIGNNAVITGTLTCDAGKAPLIDNNAQIGKKIVNINPSFEIVKSVGNSINWGFKVFLFLGALVLCVFMCLVMRKPLEQAGKMLIYRPVAMLLTGLISMIVVPIGCIALACTIIGIPVSMLLLTLYIIVIAISTVFTGASLGPVVFKKLNRWLASLIGVLILSIVIMIPIIGVILKFATIIYALGYFVQVLYVQMQGLSNKNNSQGKLNK